MVISSTDRPCGQLAIEVVTAPDEWLTADNAINASADEKRQVYISFLETRISLSNQLVQEIKHAREALI